MFFCNQQWSRLRFLFTARNANPSIRTDCKEQWLDYQALKFGKLSKTEMLVRPLMWHLRFIYKKDACVERECLCVFCVSTPNHYQAPQELNEMSEKTPQTQQKEDVGGPSKGAASVKPEEKKKLPQLGALEDDDEFEVGLPAPTLITCLSSFQDFPANGQLQLRCDAVR